jgi:hypothetical protein
MAPASHLVLREDAAMRTTLVLVLLTLSAAHPAVAGAATTTPWTHTRPLTPGAAALLADATTRSSIVRTLLQDLERTDVVVYLSDSMTGWAGEPRAYLSFVSSPASTRYLVVRIDHRRLAPFERIAWLGHELRHALEVAAAPDVKDAGGLTHLYRRIGWEDTKGRFESDAARAIGHRVRNQLFGHE